MSPDAGVFGSIQNLYEYGPPEGVRETCFTSRYPTPSLGLAFWRLSRRHCSGSQPATSTAVSTSQISLSRAVFSIGLLSNHAVVYHFYLFYAFPRAGIRPSARRNYEPRSAVTSTIFRIILLQLRPKSSNESFGSPGKQH